MRSYKTRRPRVTVAVELREARNTTARRCLGTLRFLEACCDSWPHVETAGFYQGQHTASFYGLVTGTPERRPTPF